VVQRNVREVDPASWRVKRGISSVELLAVRIDLFRLSQLLELVRLAVASASRFEVFYVNIQSVNLSRRHSDFRETLNAGDIVYCDGTGVRLGARLLGMDIPQRMTGADWIHDLCRLAVRDDLSLFFLGSASGVAEEAAGALRVRYPGIRIVGCAAGFETCKDTISRINSSGADILLIGMGSPRQERFIAQNRTDVDVPVMWAVGALFEFVSGRIPRGPHWMTEHGLEWLCRLAIEPAKLWRRYLIGNPLFMARVMREALRRFLSPSSPS
jgi:N-acetylglucosaminyldiphosphoundecaprenol N-acetyl-beta-D-mannosaminyltransferase